MEAANIVIIGAGVVGLSIAASLSEENEGVYVFEKNKRMGQEISTHNSGVIHSGIHYPNGSLKAELSVKGNKMIYDLCERGILSCRKLGKLTVATNELEIKLLEKLFKTGEANGVMGLKMLDGRAVKNLEPNVDVQMALNSPSSGIMQPDEMIDYFHTLIRKHDATVATETEVTGLKQTDSGYELSGRSAAQPFTISANAVVNCAGLFADRVASMVGLDVDNLGYRISYCKGDYYRVSGEPLVRRLVYPVPKGAGLGIHVTPDIAGSVLLGPNAFFVNEIDYNVGSSDKEFREDVSRFLPAVAHRNISFDSSGIRPKLGGTQGSFRDFIIRHEADRGFPGLINLIGIESPGLTAAPAIGEFISDIFENEIRA